MTQGTLSSPPTTQKAAADDANDLEAAANQDLESAVGYAEEPEAANDEDLVAAAEGDHEAAARETRPHIGTPGGHRGG